MKRSYDHKAETVYEACGFSADEAKSFKEETMKLSRELLKTPGLSQKVERTEKFCRGLHPRIIAMVIARYFESMKNMVDEEKCRAPCPIQKIAQSSSGDDKLMEKAILALLEAIKNDPSAPVDVKRAIEAGTFEFVHIRKEDLGGETKIKKDLKNMRPASDSVN